MSIASWGKHPYLRLYQKPNYHGNKDVFLFKNAPISFYSKICQNTKKHVSDFFIRSDADETV